MRVEWSEQALSDVEEIHGFIARDARVFAELFIDRIVESVEQLTEFPNRGEWFPSSPGLTCAS
jgi:plasmid stabilization system protein ParE